MRASKFVILLSAAALVGFVKTTTAQAANEGETKLSEKIQSPEELPNSAKKNTFKASASSLFLDLTGTRPADDGTYGFGQAALTVETLSLESEIRPGTKAYVKAQYLTDEYAVMTGGKTYDETASGLGDTLLGLNHTLLHTRGFTLLGDAGVYLPSGAIGLVNPYLAGTAHPHYKYFMQLGSGTIDETLGLTALYAQPRYALGLNGKTVLRNYDNSEHYRNGSLYQVSGWADVPLAYGFGPRLSGAYHAKSGMKGQDADVSRPAAEIYYHDMIDWNVSLSLRYSHQFAQSASLIAEIGAPLAQGMSNSDNVNLDINFFASLSAAGTF